MEWVSLLYQVRMTCANLLKRAELPAIKAGDEAVEAVAAMVFVLED